MESKSYFSNKALPTVINKDSLVRWYLQCEDDCIKFALTSHLGHPSIKKDLAKCTQLMISGRSDRYNISYKGKILGALQHHYDSRNDAGRIGVEFIPSV